jgi:hypothetical protein
MRSTQRVHTMNYTPSLFTRALFKTTV